MARFPLLMPASDGMPIIWHNRKAKEQFDEAGITPEDELIVELPAPPYAMGWLFDWFDEISQGRQQAYSGVQRLDWGNIAGWCAVRKIRLTPLERAALGIIDKTWCHVVSLHIEANRPKK